MTLGDRLLIVAILISSAIAALFIYLKPFNKELINEQTVIISCKGAVIKKVTLSEKRHGKTFNVMGRIGLVTVETLGKQIRIQEAPCHDRLCIRQGWISRPGQSIVCMPSELLITIEGNSPVDAVTR